MNLPIPGLWMAQAPEFVLGGRALHVPTEAHAPHNFRSRSNTDPLHDLSDIILGLIYR
jgi:hypothetical protein